MTHFKSFLLRKKKFVGSEFTHLLETNNIGPPAPLQTEFSCFCEMKYLLKKKPSQKNEDNTLKELNEIFLTVYGLPK